MFQILFQQKTVGCEHHYICSQPKHGIRNHTVKVLHGVRNLNVVFATIPYDCWRGLLDTSMLFIRSSNHVCGKRINGSFPILHTCISCCIHAVTWEIVQFNSISIYYAKQTDFAWASRGRHNRLLPRARRKKIVHHIVVNKTPYYENRGLRTPPHGVHNQSVVFETKTWCSKPKTWCSQPIFLVANTTKNALFCNFHPGVA